MPSLLFSLVAGYQGCKGVLVLNPSEAMRPPAPGVVRKTFLERVRLLWQILSAQSKMAVRNVFRSKQRSILAIFGIASAFSMMVVSGASFDASKYLINFQYEQVERYDFKIGLHQYVDITQGAADVKHLDGVSKAEPILEVPVTLNHKWLEKDIAIIGLPREGSLNELAGGESLNVLPGGGGRINSTGKGALYRLLTKEGYAVTLPSDGLVLSTQLAKLLDIKPGDKVTIKPFLGERKALEKNKVSQYVLLFFSFITGFAIVYNVNIISLSERERELATLMVLGMTEREIGRILVFEQGLLGLTALVLGIPLSYGMLAAIINSSGTEIFNMPLIVEPGSVLMSLLGTVLFLVVAQWKINTKIGRLSMLDVLKQQE